MICSRLYAAMAVQCLYLVFHSAILSSANHIQHLLQVNYQPGQNNLLLNQCPGIIKATSSAVPS
ncbi:hypothetical protein CS542_08110 [Pedobacter sp. IW39]|nr:hypothetical protein CS542_08110 [Pedobacter sp. IW39]